MRVVRHLTLGALLSIASYSALHGQALDASQVLAAARQALGGEKNLTSVASFVATGQTRQLRGNNLVPIEFEINCELPGKFVRRDEIPAQDTDPSVTGFKDNDLIQSAAPPGGRGGAPAPQRLVAAKQDFARLMLGVFAGSFPSYPLTVTYAAEGEAPEGKADILNVAGPDNFAARLVVQRDTHLPVMLMWQGPPANGARPGLPPPGATPPGRASPTGAPPGTPPPGAAPPGPAARVEYRMYYADYRDVNGVKWPFRIRRAVGGDTVEETTFDRVRINVKIDPRKFEAPK